MGPGSYAPVSLSVSGFRAPEYDRVSYRRCKAQHRNSMGFRATEWELSWSGPYSLK